MFVRAPSSSWSNLAFVLAGNTMIGLAIREFGHKQIMRSAVLSNNLSK
jgi:hypothetical protein